MRLLPLLLIAGCTHAAPFVTRYGMRGPQCADLQLAETRVLDAFEKYHVIPKAFACALLNGWTVELHHRNAYDIAPFRDLHHLVQCAAPSWRGTGEEMRLSCLLGYTHAEMRTFEVGEEFLPQSALAHEMLHAFDHMLKKPLGHCAWTERHRKAAIFEATSLPDDSAEPCLNK